jgi:transcriptional regulator GlxA family with amidase domain
METVHILTFDGFDELDVVAPYEVLSAAGFDVKLVTFAPAREVRGAFGLTITPDGLLNGAPDLLVVPGGGWLSRAHRGAWAEARRGVLPAAIAKRHAEGSTIAGVCSGVMLLAASGMLAGRPAVTHAGCLEDLRAAGAEVYAGARVVDDGDVITAGGVTSALDLALHIVARERGADAAEVASIRLEYEPHGAVFETSRT